MMAQVQPVLLLFVIRLVASFSTMSVPADEKRLLEYTTLHGMHDTDDRSDHLSNECAWRF